MSDLVRLARERALARAELLGDVKKAEKLRLLLGLTNGEVVVEYFDTDLPDTSEEE